MSKLPEEVPQKEAAPSLSALIQSARTEAATKGGGGAVGLVVARLARGDGSATVTTLTSEGFPENVIVAAVTTDLKDKRVKPRARLGIVAGEPMIWLTTTGWQSAGRSSGRERPPSAESASHAAAPGHINAWLKRVTEDLPVDVGAVTGEPCRAFSDQVKALAWARIQGVGDTTGGAGSLTGGLVPDALIVERFANSETFTSAWGYDPATHDDVAEQTLALEIEDSRKASEPLRWKVERWEAATELKAVIKVVWVVRTATVRDRLFALGVGTTRRPEQLLVPGARIGLPGSELLADSGSHWWPVRVYDQQQRSALTAVA
jgi:hypothetical protein